MSAKRYWHTPLSRRRFLQAAGAAAGTLIGGPVFAREQPDGEHRPVFLPPGITTGRDRLKIGVLLPESRWYPALGANVLAGIQLFVQYSGGQAGGRAIDLVARPYGVSPAQATAQARQLIEQDGAELLIGMIGSQTIPLLDPLLRARRTPLVMATIGANVARPQTISPYIARVSLQQWQATWSLGAWSAQNMGRTAFIATSFYESGYDSLYSFQHGFEANGGRVQGRFVSHHPARGADLPALLAAIEAAQPDVVFAAYSGRQATDFVQSYAQSSLAGAIPVVGSAFMVDEALLPEHGRAALDIKSALSWSPDLQLPANQDFRAAFQTRTGQAADAFAVLGYDTARLVMAALEATSGAALTAARFDAALNDTSLAGPRGALAMDRATRTMSGPLYLRTVRRQGSAIGNAVIDQLAAPPVDDVQAELGRSSSKTGWINAYLCA